MSTTAWPPAIGLTTRLVDRKSTVLPMHASIHISAPAALIWSILLDTTNYLNWNTFCPLVTIHTQPAGVPTDTKTLQPGTSFTFHVVMDLKRPKSYTDTQLRVTDVSTPDAPSAYIAREVLDMDPAYSADLGRLFRISWTVEGGFVARGLRSERYHEIIVRGENECEVRTWECQGGTLAYVVKWMYGGVLNGKFADWCRDLKGEAERQFSEEQTKAST